MTRNPKSTLSRATILVKNVTIALCAYAVAVLALQLHSKGIANTFAGEKGSAKDVTTTKPAVPKTSSSLRSGTNSKLRPASLVKAKDNFLGPRPHVDTFANVTYLIQECRGSAEGLEKMFRVGDCMRILEAEESKYFYIPKDRPSASSPDYPSIESAKPHTKESIGTCPGPIVQYHTYWTGPATWRVELFIKSYLYTQNLPCSRLNIWLDADQYPTAVSDMMHDKLFQKFLPLVDRGDIILRAWKFPSRIPLPKLDDDAVQQSPLMSRLFSKAAAAFASDAEDKEKEVSLGDNVVLRGDGSRWVVLNSRQMTFLPVAISDAVRFVVLHLFGGVYCDMDVVMIRDMRPLLIIPDANWAERWAAHPHPGDFNTAIMALRANTSLSSYLLQGGIRMGFNFHPRIIGRMAYKDGRIDEFYMFETALFDPIWTEFNWARQGPCTVPCFHDYGAVFVGDRDKVAAHGEWESYTGPRLPETIPDRIYPSKESSEDTEGSESDPDALAYDFELDRYPPNNRTLENFFRGAFTYHIHNQWGKHPQPNSWLDIMGQAQDDFFAGNRTNPYGETWTGPTIPRYDTYPEFA